MILHTFMNNRILNLARLHLEMVVVGRHRKCAKNAKKMLVKFTNPRTAALEQVIQIFKDTRYWFSSCSSIIYFIFLLTDCHVYGH